MTEEYRPGERTEDYDYELPEELIAQHPEEKRDQSRLMVIHRDSGEIEDKVFHDILDELNPGDLLIVNDTKVLPARLHGRKVSEQNPEEGAVCEVLLLSRLLPEQLSEETQKKLEAENPDDAGLLWEVMVRPGRRLKPGAKVCFSDTLSCEILEIREEGLRAARFDVDGIFEEELEKLGEMPLPPYIHEKLEDNSRYQTVYARDPGSAAAPTAGLHFTEELLDQIKEKGVKIAPVTLNVGLGTFRPVKEDSIFSHHMHTETYSVPQSTIDRIEETKKNGGRVIAVGTTSVRTLESAAQEDGTIRPGAGETSIFIYPGYEFKVVDALITNFHLPKSTLLMLVSALYDREKMLGAYRHAVDERYRFFSFGDAMFIE